MIFSAVIKGQNLSSTSWGSKANYAKNHVSELKVCNIKTYETAY